MNKISPTYLRPQSSFKAWAGIWQRSPMAAVAMPLPHYHSSSTSQDDAFKVEKSFPVLQQNGGF